jgi:hypothetical protein
MEAENSSSSVNKAGQSVLIKPLRDAHKLGSSDMKTDLDSYDDESDMRGPFTSCRLCDANAEPHLPCSDADW